MKCVVAINDGSINDLVDGAFLTAFTLVVEQRPFSFGMRTILGIFN